MNLDKLMQYTGNTEFRNTKKNGTILSVLARNLYCGTLLGAEGTIFVATLDDATAALDAVRWE